MPKSVITRSTCCGSAPSSTKKFASRVYLWIIRLPTKPSQTPTTTGTLRIFLARDKAVARASSEVS